MNHPLISIVVPIYNSEKYLERCILSLINQTLKDIEIILVNDASPDNSMEIVGKYAALDSRIVVIDSKVNIVASRNLGIKAAKANYLGFVDADDWVEPEMYEELYNATQNETIDVVAADVRNVYTSGRTDVEINLAESAFSSSRGLKEYYAQYGGRLFANIWKRELVTEDLLFKEHCLYCDAIVPLWYMKANTFAKVSKPLYNYFINDSSVTHLRDNPRFFDRTVGAFDMIGRSKRNGLYENYKEEIDYIFYRLYYLNTIFLISRAFTKLPYKEVKEVKNTFHSLVDIKNNKYYKKHKNEGINRIPMLLYNYFYLGIACIYSQMSFNRLASSLKVRSRIKGLYRMIAK